MRMHPFDLVEKKKSEIWCYPSTYLSTTLIEQKPGHGSMVPVSFIPIVLSEKLKEEFVI